MNTYFNEDIFPNKYEKIEDKNKTQTPYILQNINMPCIEELLKFNKGKKVIIHMGFPNTTEHKDLKGIIEQSGQEYITLSNPQTGAWNILPTIYIDYITFEENINYN